MALPLDGIRVIDWTIWQQGPVASVMLHAVIAKRSKAAAANQRRRRGAAASLPMRAGTDTWVGCCR